ncbi:hypothetical protein [Pseudooceanicola sp.]|uniref:hypothetical protein n=1 Tax=Pseudooceanicola sp. TaxID=1914328 RepID=UPI0035C67F27
MYRGFVILCAVLILICLMPLFGVLWSSWFANRHGCTLNEAARHPCVVNGTDWGDWLAAAFVSGWFMLLTLPVAALILGALILVTVIRWIRRARQ